MDIQKIAAWSNVGSFLVGCLTIYLVSRPQHLPTTPENGVAVQPVTSIHPAIWIFLIALFISGLLHFFAAVIQRKQLHALPLIPALPPQAAVPSFPEPVPDSVPSLKTVFSPPATVAGRTFVGSSITPEYLVGLFEGHTSIQARKFIEPFIGKWMRLSGELEEVSGSRPNFAILQFSGRGLRGGGAGVFMFFQTEEWVSRLAILRRGDRLTVVGKIENVISIRVELESCELEE
jgi:hypothetical protein